VLVLEAQRLIRASAEHVFNHLAPTDHLTRYTAPLWMTADPSEKRGVAQTVALRGYFVGLPVESVQRVTLRPPTSLECVQVRGTLRAFSARCTVRSTEDGTEVAYRLEVDPGIPMLTEEAARQFLFQYLGRMLDRIKLAAERKTPGRRVTRAVAAPGARPAQPALADEEGPEPAEPQVEDDAVPAAEPAGPPPRRAPVEARRSAAHAPERPQKVRQRPGTRAGGPVAPRATVPTPPAPTADAPAVEGTAQAKKRRRRRRRRRPDSASPTPPARNA